MAMGRLLSRAIGIRTFSRSSAPLTASSADEVDDDKGDDKEVDANSKVPASHDVKWRCQPR